MANYVWPTYRFDVSAAFPELKQGNVQSTFDAADRISGYALAMAYIMSGNKFKGILADLTIEQFFAEVEEACFHLNLDPERLVNWAQSLLIPPEATLPDVDLDKIPRYLEGKGITLHNYQIKEAAWSAHRLGSILALGCGIGKSATSTAAAIAAARLGKCSTERCHIVCPLNAVMQWKPYLVDLKKTFKEVLVLSCDSLHKYQNISPVPGGAVIFDEIHKLKNFNAFRTQYGYKMRANFEWAVCLTGTLLHTGAEGVLSVQDIACPGLSRYTDKWSFGNDFHCIIEKQIGPRIRHSLGIPPMSVRDDFVRYLSRGMRSLSFESLAVRAVIKLPNQERIVVDTWEKSDWLKNMEKKAQDEFFAKVQTQGGKPTVEMFMAENPYHWPPELDWKKLFALTAVGIMYQNIEEWEKNGQEGNKPGLPSFPELLHKVSKMGNVDKVSALQDGFIRFIGPLTYGPKIQWVLQWLKDNPEEFVVIGAASVQTINLLKAELEKLKLDHRLIRGGVGPKDRDTFIKDFQDGKFKIMLLQQVAGSESVTLTRAKNSILIDHDWSPITYTQFLARTCRQGQTHECTHYDLVFNAIQEEIVRKLKRGEAFDSETRAQIEQEVNYKQLKEQYG